MFSESYSDELFGAIITKVEGVKKGSEDVFIHTDIGVLHFHHHQECCEHVCIEDFQYSGDEDITGSRILNLSETSNSEESGGDSSCTWTYYTIVTTKGSLDMRWLGESNGYYSEEVSVLFSKKDKRETYVGQQDS